MVLSSESGLLLLGFAMRRSPVKQFPLRILLYPGLGGTGAEDFSIASQLFVQAEGVVITIVWSAVVAFIAYKIVDMVIGLRVSEEEEREGLDITQHGESAYRT